MYKLKGVELGYQPTDEDSINGIGNMVESSVYQSGVFKEKKDLEMEMMSKL
jgi:hypothetical protein